ncbi:MmgE/PrpD family protein [Labrenzia sp. DG1229]|uniref:MmgE/PrpD family protein n=1 Tax=Labrenzia sp. DG1229 TaxID=681847 RepID=UPI00048F34F1|nr:MmgE/PrpD family protein [Labrenzia sp. DG1229]
MRILTAEAGPEIGRRLEKLDETLRSWSRWATALSWSDVPAEGQQLMRDVVIDTVGCAIGGSDDPLVQGLISKVSPGAAAAWASGFPGLDPAWATFVNGTASTVLDLDEFVRGAGHPAIHVVPGAFALAEQLGASGDQLFRAIHVGYEFAVAIGNAGSRPADVHPHGTILPVGGAAACATLLDLSPEDWISAVCAAGSIATVMPYAACYSGQLVRNTFAGDGARRGLTAALVASAGGTADTELLLFALDRASDEVLDFAQPPEHGAAIVTTNIFKRHAACALASAAIDASLAIAAERPVKPDPSVKVRVEVGPASRDLIWSHPANPVSAKFSLSYGVSAALLRQAFDESVLQQEVFADALRDRFEDQIDVSIDPDLSASQARVEVRFGDGTSIIRQCDKPYDLVRDGSSSELDDKFMRLCAPKLSDKAAESLLGRLRASDGAASLAALWRT